MVGIDFSPRSFAAAQMAVALAAPTGASVELVHVVETQLSDSDALILGLSVKDLQNLLIKEVEVTLDKLAEQLEYQNLHKTITVGSPAVELARLSEEHRSDILIVGDTGAESLTLPRGVGATAYRLVEHGPRYVLVVKAGYSGKIRSVAAAISFVPVADDVMRQAYLIARLFKAELHVVRAIPDITELRFRIAVLPFDLEHIISESENYNKLRLEDFVGKYNIDDVAVKISILSGKPGQVLVEYLQNENIDVVVIGTGTSYRVAGFPIGSTTHSVLNRTLSNVYVVRSLETAP